MQNFIRISLEGNTLWNICQFQTVESFLVLLEWKYIKSLCITHNAKCIYIPVSYNMNNEASMCITEYNQLNCILEEMLLNAPWENWIMFWFIDWSSRLSPLQQLRMFCYLPWSWRCFQLKKKDESGDTSRNNISTFVVLETMTQTSIGWVLHVLCYQKVHHKRT